MKSHQEQQTSFQQPSQRDGLRPAHALAASNGHRRNSCPPLILLGLGISLSVAGCQMGLDRTKAWGDDPAQPTVIPTASTQALPITPITTEQSQAIAIGMTYSKAQDLLDSPGKLVCVQENNNPIYQWPTQEGGSLFIRTQAGKVQSKWMASELFRTIAANCR